MVMACTLMLSAKPRTSVRKKAMTMLCSSVAPKRLEMSAQSVPLVMVASSHGER